MRKIYCIALPKSVLRTASTVVSLATGDRFHILRSTFFYRIISCQGCKNASGGASCIEYNNVRNVLSIPFFACMPSRWVSFVSHAVPRPCQTVLIRRGWVSVRSQHVPAILLVGVSQFPPVVPSCVTTRRSLFRYYTLVLAHVNPFSLHKIVLSS